MVRNKRRHPADSGANEIRTIRRDYYFMPESCLFFIYSARSAALTWPGPMNGPGVLVLVEAAGALGFAACFLAKAAEVETARIARPTRIIFFMLCSLEKDAQQSNTNLG